MDRREICTSCTIEGSPSGMLINPESQLYLLIEYEESVHCTEGNTYLDTPDRWRSSRNSAGATQSTPSFDYPTK